MPKLLKYFVLLCVISAMVLVAYGWQWLHKPLVFPASYSSLTVQQGATLNGLAEQLASADILEYPELWVLYARLLSRAQLYEGEFYLSGTESPIELLKTLQSGKVIEYSVTIIEGATITDALALIQQQEKIQSQLTQHFDPEHSRIDGVNQHHLEGWFYPDTYYFVAGE